jgi:bifunctional DNA-binding transcriptional regulator/antitoxin component of YhaV-PrlF toxin-antitoxin module
MSKPPGFEEEAAPSPMPPLEAPPMAHAVLGQDGRLLIPAALREAAGINRGERLVLRVEGDHLVVESFRTTIKRLQALFEPMKEPGVSYVDKFLAERRAMWGEE